LLLEFIAGGHQAGTEESCLLTCSQGAAGSGVFDAGNLGNQLGSKKKEAIA